MEFVVKPNVDLSKYGFEKRDDEWWWFRKTKYRGSLNIIISDRRVLIPSASKDSIAILCKMYKNNDLEIVSSETFTSMKLTEDEVELIKQRRNQCQEK